MKKQILTNRDELSVVSALVKDQDPEYVLQVGRDMVDTAKTLHDCVGLAAPQIGHFIRMILVQFGKGQGHRFLLDPEIIRKWGAPTDWQHEGCFSVPGTIDKPIRVPRYKKILVRYFNPDKKEYTERKFVTWDARVVQHEIDHLDGILIGGK